MALYTSTVAQGLTRVKLITETLDTCLSGRSEVEDYMDAANVMPPAKTL